MKKIIYKEVDTETAVTEMEVPKGSKVLNVEGQAKGLYVHFIVPVGVTEMETVKVHAYHDEQEFDDSNLTYIGEDMAKTHLSPEMAEKLYPEQFKQQQMMNEGMDGLAKMMDGMGLGELMDSPEGEGMAKKFEEINEQFRKSGLDATCSFHVFLEN
jgi:hypothetical protein